MSVPGPLGLHHRWPACPSLACRSSSCRACPPPALARPVGVAAGAGRHACPRQYAPTNLPGGAPAPALGWGPGMSRPTHPQTRLAARACTCSGGGFIFVGWLIQALADMGHSRQADQVLRRLCGIILDSSPASVTADVSARAIVAALLRQPAEGIEQRLPWLVGPASAAVNLYLQLPFVQQRLLQVWERGGGQQGANAWLQPPAPVGAHVAAVQERACCCPRPAHADVCGWWAPGSAVHARPAAASLLPACPLPGCRVRRALVWPTPGAPGLGHACAHLPPAVPVLRGGRAGQPSVGRGIHGAAGGGRGRCAGVQGA